MANMNIKSDLRTAPGYQVLAAAGKKILRPGGRLATSKLLAWADFQPGETVLELASSFGNSAINLAKTYGVKVVGVEKNSDSIARARENIQAAGLTGQVEIIEGDIFHLEEIPDKFDYIFAEAILTMQSMPLKAKILTQVKARLKPGGKFLIHELLAQKKLEEIHRDLSKANHINATPLSEIGWINACENVGLKVEQYQIGAIKILNLIDIIRDEGIADTGKFFWNVLRQKVIRDRVLEMKNVFQKYRDDLGYIILCAK